MTTLETLMGMDDRAAVPTFKLCGEFSLRSPLSHIGEAVSTVAYLVQDPVVQPDGTVTEVFCYNGNAWRGQLRDLMARRVADAVGGNLNVNAFHFLFSGGRLDKQEDTLDLAAARSLRAALPMLGLLGGGIGSQLLGGRLRVFGSYPVCQEAIPILPARLHEDADKVSYKALTFEKEFSRRDDGKLEDGDRYMMPVNAPRKLNAKGKVMADQMRMTSELVAPGTRLHTELHMAHVNSLEVGCLLLALVDFAEAPCIGGQANRGHGLVNLRYREAGADQDLFVLEDGRATLTPEAQAAVDRYTAYLEVARERMLEALACV